MRQRDTGRLAVLASLCCAAGLAACGGDDGVAPPAALEPSFTLVSAFQPVDLTPDGRIALVEQQNGEFYFYHTDTGTLEFKGDASAPGRTTGISADRMVSAIHGASQAGIWTERSGWTDLPSVFPSGCGEETASAWDVTADGRAVVGMAWNDCGTQAFRWDATGSGLMTLLQPVGEGSDGRAPESRASVISDDGSVIAGWTTGNGGGWWPAVWRPDGTGFLLEGLTDGGEVLGVSHDGKVLVGSSGENAFYWTEAGGYVSIGRLPADEGGFGGGMANAVGADGKVIFGGSGLPFWGTPKAFVWTQAAGMRPLTDIVLAAGLTIPEGIALVNVLATSNDGTIVLGQASMADGNRESFVLKLPLSAYGL